MSSSPKISDVLESAADELERLLGDNESLRSIDPAVLQRLLTAFVKTYAAKLELGDDFTPFSREREPPTPTETIVLANDLLTAAEIEPFEVAMWRGWGNARNAERRLGDVE